QYESAHPHREYRVCYYCGYVKYLGTNTVLAHGNGVGATCPDCGDHSFIEGPVYGDEYEVSCPCGRSAYLQTWDLFNYQNVIYYMVETADYEDFVLAGIDTWESAQSGFFEEYPVEGTADLVANGWFDNSSPIFVHLYQDGVLFFNSSNLGSCSDSQIESFTIHELGHALGIADSESDDSVMYYGYHSNTSLINDDVYAAEAIYERLW
ncbi:MAG: matrixin family metalloprotease, partial [Oscillospiraceae bacterium]|nr:matrixin family metalloprotease [Oscillospiraceae bacterium]